MEAPGKILKEKGGGTSEIDKSRSNPFPSKDKMIPVPSKSKQAGSDRSSSQSREDDILHMTRIKKAKISRRRHMKELRKIIVGDPRKMKRRSLSEQDPKPCVPNKTDSQGEKPTSVSMHEFIERVLRFERPAGYCPHYLVGSASFKDLRQGKYHVTEAHKALISRWAKNEGEASEKFAIKYYPKSVRHESMISGEIPFLCSTPDLVANIGEEVILVEVKSFRTKSLLKDATTRKSIFSQVVVSLAIFQLKRADVLLFVRAEPEPILEEIIHVHAVVNPLNFEGSREMIILNYVTFLCEYFSVFFTEPTLEDRQKTQQLIFKYIEENTDKSPRKNFVYPNPDQPCNMIARNFQTLKKQERDFISSNDPMLFESGLESGTVRSSQKFIIEQSRALISDLSYKFRGFFKKRARSQEICKVTSKTYWRTRSQSVKAHTRFKEMAIVENDPIPTADIRRLSITFDADNYRALSTPFGKLRFD